MLMQCPLAEAAGKCRHAWMRDALMVLAKRHEWEHLLPPTSPDDMPPLQSVQSLCTSSSENGCAVAGAAASYVSDRG